MQEENNTIQQPQVPVLPQTRNAFIGLISKIPKPVFLVAAIAIGIPLILLVLKGPETVTKKPVSEFSLVESSPSDQQNATPVIAQPTFVFSKKIGIKEADLPKYFTISPKVAGSWHLEKNGQVVYFSSDKKQTGSFPHTFEYQTAYLVTIDKSLRSDNGKNLAEEEHITFKTMQNPEFGLTAYKSLLPVPAGDAIQIEIQSDQEYSKYGGQIQQQATQPYEVTIQKATKEELLSYFSYRKDSYLAINKIPDSLLNAPVVKAKGQIISKSNNYTKIMSVVNPVFKTPGIYYVTFGNKVGHDKLFVIVSNHVNQVVKNSKRTIVITTDSTSSRAISGMKVEYYKAADKVELLDSNVTNGDGIATRDTVKDDMDFVITTKGEDVAVTQARTYYRASSSTEDNVQVFSYTDRPIYRPGDTVHYKAVLRVRDDSGKAAVKQKDYYVKYSSTFEAKKGDYKKVTTDENGTITFDTVLPYSETNAYPYIALARKDSKGEYESIDNLQLLVEFYKKPEMDITVVTNEKEYISRDTSHMTVIGKTNYGQPLSSIGFSYRVMLVSYEELKDRDLEQIERDTYSNYYGGGQELANGTSSFDKNGKADIQFSTDLSDKFVQSQVALLEVTPNIGAIPSFGKIVKLIHRGEFALFFDGVAGDTTAGISGYVEALDHKNPRQHTGSMKGSLTLTKKEYYSDSGQVIETRSIELDSKGRAGFTFRDIKEGSYELKSEFVDARGNKVTGIQMTYVGSPTLNAGVNSINVGFDKQKYKDGDTAKATITSNFMLNDVYLVISENRGNLTRIVSAERMKGDGKTRTLNYKIAVTKDTGGTVGVNLYAVSNRQAVLGQGTFQVDRKTPKMNTTISFDKKRYQPGEKVNVKLTTKDENGKGIEADNSLSIIDAAILQLGKLKTGIVEQFSVTSAYIGLSYYDSLTGIYADGPGGGGGCFLEGTQILMGDGTTKNIENIKAGETILTKKSETSNEMVKNIVTKTFAHTVAEYLTINNRLKVTPIHRIFLNGKWAEASEAKIGDTLLDINGTVITIASITKQQGIFRVYNLTTTPSHTFFADGIYVHNEKGMDARQNFVDTLYWNPHIKTDRNGEATVSFKLADNVTTFTAQAFSNTKDSLFGEATASIVSYKDITLIPSFSSFYYEHDKPVISVMAQNSTDRDMNLTIHTSVKELPGENSQDIKIAGNDLEVVFVPVDLANLKANATFIVEAKDRSGKVVDSVLVKKPILPQGNITASWQSFEDSFDHTFTPQFPKLDINRMIVAIVPNAAAKFFRPYHYLPSYLSISTGEGLYSYAYILSRTRDGFVAPTLFHYAKDRNDFRESVQELLEYRDENVWNWPPNNYSKDSFEASNVWVAKGFEQAVKYNMLDEITNASDMAKRTLEFFKSPQNNAPIDKSQFPQGWPPPPPPIEVMSPTPTMYPTPQVSLTPTPTTTSSGIVVNPTVVPPDPSGLGPTPTPIIYTYPPGSPLPYSLPKFERVYSNDEKLARAFAYGELFTNDNAGFDKTPEGLATQFLSGDNGSLQKLLSTRLPSADDRYLWDGYTYDSPSMPVLALVEKGDIIDADKAIRGISFSQMESSPFEMYAAFKYLERKNIKLNKVTLKVSMNGEKDFEVTGKEDVSDSVYPSFSMIYSSRNSKDGKLHLEFSTDSDLPIYGTITEFSYGNTQSGFGKGNYRSFDAGYKREYKDTTTGQAVPLLETGKTGVVVLSSDMGRIIKGNSTSDAYSFIAQDSLSPNLMYLEQYDSYYNPQFQSVFKKLFAPERDQVASYSLPESYSDQAVFFSGSGNIGSRASILPYVVFNASAGTYYRPKSSIVFPVLGIIQNEK